ncbi:metal-binding domain containing of MaoC dehydratase [Oceanicola sp. 22II-s10i]|uniref:FAS1-like dehydratase domain-containing protein n=1 Tax=Oceanicola sp. 22II-s10i TaxID=1317116 RepID=UPI000B526E31|nr:MaoC family dehydratase N-terminal domain-containing protein [Oceanicola sp. 22II-s10i]OWU85682.1 metal-binding domain containing of MaoC dehydratase [Oceanicola sp. 22II-s10i]
MTDIDIDHLRTWIGKEEAVEELLSDDLVRRFNAVTGYAAPADRTGGRPAPQLVHLCLAPPVAPNDQLGPDGHPARGGFLPPVPLPNRMWAGGEMRFLRELSTGRMVKRHSTIEDVVLKQGRTGPLCFVTVRHRIKDSQGVAIEERQDIVYREATSGPAPTRPAAAPGAHHEVVRADSVVLFRYSAITFNGHRIHYDQPYVTQVEGYPGLIVHGPLQATWLCHLAERLKGKPPAKFTFRSLGPLFDVDTVTLNAEEDGDALRLWTAAEGGPVAMEARAEW